MGFAICKNLQFVFVYCSVNYNNVINCDFHLSFFFEVLFPFFYVVFKNKCFLSLFRVSLL